MNNETRSLINWWKLQANNQPDHFIKFFIMYMCLDAWVTSESGLDRDDQKLQWLIESDNGLRHYWDSTPHKKAPLQGLKKIGRVEDMRPNHRGEYKYLSDIDDFRQVVEFIYQVRCNLFHGGKSPVNTNDEILVTLSFRVLASWIEWTLIKTK